MRSSSRSGSSATSCFFFNGHSHHPEIHSFPTRRSSDLGGRQLAISRLSERGWRMIDCRASTVKERSEEHTSELQSRGHLVCRLLLEKKKDVMMNLVIRVLYELLYPDLNVIW